MSKSNDDNSTKNNSQVRNGSSNSNEEVPKLLSLRNLRQAEEFRQLCCGIVHKKSPLTTLEGSANRQTPTSDGDERTFLSNISSSERSKNNSPASRENEPRSTARETLMSLVSGSIERKGNTRSNNNTPALQHGWSQRNEKHEYEDELYTGHRIFSHFPYPVYSDEEINDIVPPHVDVLAQRNSTISNVDPQYMEEARTNGSGNESTKEVKVKHKQKKKAAQLNDDSVAISICCGLRILPSYVFDNIKNSLITAIYLSNNALEYIPESIGGMLNLKYMDLSHNKLTTLPKTISKCFNLFFLDVTNNLITHFPDNLGLLKRRLEALYVYNNPLRNDLLHIFNFEDPGKALLDFLQRRFYLRQVPPPRREWRYIHSSKTGQSHPHLPTISVMTYNILSYKYLFSSRFNYCPEDELKWEYRKAVVFEEIIHYAPSIVTMQEVPKGDYESYFSPKLIENGYEGIFFPKSRIRKTKEDMTQHIDGCAIFWQTRIFAYIVNFNIEFKKLICEIYPGNDEKTKRVNSFDNVGVIVALMVKGDIPEGEVDETLPHGIYYRPLLISTAHIHWDPEYADVKLIQSMLLMKALQHKRAYIALQLKCNVHEIPVIITGDFNSVRKSSVIEFMCKAKISKQDDGLMLFKNCKKLNILSSIAGDPNFYHHALKDIEMVDMSNYEFTNFTPDFVDVIDYIFYTSATLSACGIIEPPSAEWIKNSEIIGFPHPHFPSDHIPIVANFFFNKINPSIFSKFNF
uniref:Endo/exonuclease/phosphatase domain-containing protein n=1 Tax=Parastrongyloides trichosuri TaxID=131310 RepID=A0A0N4ZB03_PARTI